MFAVPPTRGRRFVALAMFLAVAPAFTQEIPRPPIEREIPRDRETPRNETENERKVREFIKNGWRIDAPPGTIRTREERAALAKLPPPPMDLRWGEAHVPALKDIEEFLQSDPRRTVMSTGTPPADRASRQQWRELKEKYADRIIIHEPESANKTPQGTSAAIALGARPLDPATVRIFNALPHEMELQRFAIEQNRMAIGGTPETWRKIHEDIKTGRKASAKSGPPRRGTSWTNSAPEPRAPSFCMRTSPMAISTCPALAAEASASRRSSRLCATIPRPKTG